MMWWWGPCAGSACCADAVVVVDAHAAHAPTTRFDSLVSLGTNATTATANEMKKTAVARPLSPPPLGIYRARDVRTKECVALKVLPRALLRRRATRRRLRQEIGVLTLGRDHDNILHLHGVYPAGKTSFAIAFELARGGEVMNRFLEPIPALPSPALAAPRSLEAPLEQSSLAQAMLFQWSEHAVQRVVAAAVAAVQFLHQQGIAHGAVRPEHLLYSDLEPEARVILVGFGRAAPWQQFTLVNAMQQQQHQQEPRQQVNSFNVDAHSQRFLPLWASYRSQQMDGRPSGDESNRLSWREVQHLDTYAIGVTMHVLLCAAFPHDDGHGQGATIIDSQRGDHGPGGDAKRGRALSSSLSPVDFMLSDQMPEVQQEQEHQQHYFGVVPEQDFEEAMGDEKQEGDDEDEDEDGEGSVHVIATKTGEMPCMSRAARDLLRRLLIRDPNRAMRIHDISCHPWIAGQVASDVPWCKARVARHARFATEYAAEVSAAASTTAATYRDSLSGGGAHRRRDSSRGSQFWKRRHHEQPEESPAHVLSDEYESSDEDGEDAFGAGRLSFVSTNGNLPRSSESGFAVPGAEFDDRLSADAYMRLASAELEETTTSVAAAAMDEHQTAREAKSKDKRPDVRRRSSASESIGSNNGAIRSQRGARAANATRSPAEFWPVFATQRRWLSFKSLSFRSSSTSSS